MRSSTLAASAAALVAALALPAVPLRAQGTRPDTATLPVVPVTTSRVGAPIFDLPLAVTRLQPADWAGRPGYGLADALALVPGVLAQSRYGSSDVRLTIRGFGSRGAGDRSNSGTSRGVRLLLNGIPETEPDGRTSFDAFDLGTATGIEVIRSNASALWGNAAGGVVNVSTRPTLTGSTFGLDLTSGGFGLKRAVLRTGTRAGGATLWANAASTTFDGWRANSMGDRILLDAGLTAPLDKDTDLGAFLSATRNRFNVPGPLTQAQVDADPSQANATYLTRLERRNNVLGRLGLTLEHRFDNDEALSAMLFVTPKYLQRSERGTYRDFNRYHAGGNAVYRRGTEMGGVKGTLALGTDLAYQDGTILFYGLTPQGTRALDLRDNKREGANNLGFFATQELALADGKLLASVGARYDAITYTYSSNINPKLNSTKSFTGVSPKLGLTWRLAPTHSVYASVGGGVEVPAGNETDPASTFGQDTVTAINPLLDPVRSLTYEVGTRRVMALGGVLTSVSYDVAAFWTTVTNEIVPYRGGRFYFTAGKARRSGVELGATVTAEGGWSLTSAVTAMDAKYTTYVVDSVHYGKPGKVADYSGKRVVGVPQLVWNSTLGWSPSAWGGVRVQGGVQHTSDYVVDDANVVRVPSATVLDAGVIATRPMAMGDGGLGVRWSVMVQNLTDRRYVGSAFLNPDVVGGVPVAFEPGLPRQVVVGVSVGWVR